MASHAETRTMAVARVHDFARRCLVAVGAVESDACAVADVLLDADRRGIFSHGAARLGRYVRGLERGWIRARARVQVVSERPAMAVLDADNGLGQPAAIQAMKLAIDKARESGIAIVGVRRTNHFGIAGFYARMAAAHDMVGFATSNASPQVAPQGGTEPMYGTNPVAAAAPTGTDPMCIDMATSIAPRGRLEQRAWAQAGLPSGWAIDPTGSPATDLAATISGLKTRAGHALLPLGGAESLNGGHKGYCLGLLVDLLCGPLLGSAWGRRVYNENRALLGQLFVAIDVAAARPVADFEADAGLMFAALRNVRAVVANHPVRIPGERSARAAREHHSEIAYPAAVVSLLLGLQDEFGVGL